MKTLAVAALVLASPALGITVEVTAVDMGYYTAAGVHDPANRFYNVGGSDAAGERRHFYVFDLSTLHPSQLLSATLRLDGGFIFTSPLHAFETLRVTSYTGDVDALINGTGGLAAFDALGNGTTYGEVSRNQGGSTFFEIPLNQAFLDDFTYGGRLVLSGRITTMDPGGAMIASDQYTPRLILNNTAIPLPTTAGLAATGCLILASRRRRAR